MKTFNQFLKEDNSAQKKKLEKDWEKFIKQSQKYKSEYDKKYKKASKLDLGDEVYDQWKQLIYISLEKYQEFKELYSKNNMGTAFLLDELARALGESKYDLQDRLD